MDSENLITYNACVFQKTTFYLKNATAADSSQSKNGNIENVTITDEEMANPKK